MRRNAKAEWKGSLKKGNGVLTTQSLVLDQTQYSYKSRFDQGKGTNPEELMAAAHAGCFTMMINSLLEEAGYSPELLETNCRITFEDGRITLSELILDAKIPNITEEDFQKIAEKAKTDCPVSQAFVFEKTLKATLVQ